MTSQGAGQSFYDHWPPKHMMSKILCSHPTGFLGEYDETGFLGEYDETGFLGEYDETLEVLMNLL